MNRGGRGVLFVCALLALTGVTAAQSEVTEPSVHFVAAGDFSMSTQAGNVFTAMGSADPDLALALGDLSYGATGAEQTWCDFVSSRFGEGEPFELIAGNHESNGQNGNINDFSACLPNQLPGLHGTYGRQWYVDVPQADPLVRFIAVSPALPFPDGTWDYSVGSPRYTWAANAIDAARTAGIPWVVVGMHKPCLSLGQYACDPGADLVNLLLTKKVDLVLHGHEHLYQRTKQLGLGTGCTSLTIGSYNASCVKAAGPAFTAGLGSVFATVGTGGIDLRDVNAVDPEAPYFMASSGANVNPTWGFLDVNATATVLTAGFARAGGGSFTDSFTITKGAPPPNQNPVAEFGSTTSGLTANVNGSQSFDPDGTIASYAWTFGDGGTATGVTATHAYTAAGTYDVTLSVTDDDGATGSVTHPVTVSAVTTLASDDFERTLASGWGTANTGGAWTNTGSSAQHGVNNGTGRLSMLTAGTGPQAYLNSVSSSATQLTVDFHVDKMPVGGTSGLDQSFLLRRIGSEDYRAKVRILPGGVVRLGLSRVAAGGAQTVIVPEQVVSGMTYSAGMVLKLRAQAFGTSPTTLRAKVWAATGTEPVNWQVSANDTYAGLQGSGAIGIHSYLASSVTNAPVVARFDTLRVTAL